MTLQSCYSGLDPESRTALKVAFFISLLWEVAKQFFGWYVFNIGRFSMVYGSMSALIIFFWVYYS